MLSNQQELNAELEQFTDAFYRKNGVAVYKKPYSFSWNNTDFIGAGSSHMHAIIPKKRIPFEVPFYNELSVIPRLLDQLNMSESVIVQTEDLLKKSTGISIAAKINGIGFRRKLIARLYHLSQAMDIQSWNHVTLNAGGLNVFSSNGCMVLMMPCLEEDWGFFDDESEWLDADMDINYESLEALSSRQAGMLAIRKQSLNFPKLKELNLETALILSEHCAVAKTNAFQPDAIPGEVLRNESKTISFGPDLVISDEVMQCMLKCYSDLVFEEESMRMKCADLKESMFQKRILRRLDELLFTPQNFLIVYSQNDSDSNWYFEHEHEDSKEMIHLQAIDDTGFLTSLFHGYELHQRFTNKFHKAEYTSYWRIDTDAEKISNRRIDSLRKEINGDDHVEITVKANEYERTYKGNGKETELVGFPLKFIWLSPHESEQYSDTVSDFVAYCENEYASNYGSDNDFSSEYEIRLKVKLADTVVIES
jgi:hypothetical protein